MCGFTVIFSYAPDAPPVNVGEVRQINERMRARGPDGEGEGRVQARQFAENMEASIGGGGFVEGDVKAGKSKL